MPTIRHTINEGSRHMLHDMLIGTFLDGECYALATALHEGLEWPMFGLMEGAVVRHAVVASPGGQYFDARGFVSEEQLGEPFGLRPPYTMKQLEAIPLRDGESEFDRLRAMNAARKLAEVVWPKLPWKDTFAARTAAFLDELEALSRKHGLWIRSPYSAACPVIATSDGAEGGYEMTPTDDGVTFVIDRYFNRQI